MMGHTPIGKLIMRAGLFEAANVPFMLQNTGGNVTRALVVHMASVFPTATLHHVTATDLWARGRGHARTEGRGRHCRRA